jgi:glycosyltransferase involved in cell wall biosynthesis
MPETNPYLSVVIPAYNEARRIAQSVNTVIDYLRTRPYTWQLLVIDDGSIDETRNIAHDLCEGKPELTIIGNEHRGKAFTVRTGVLASRGDYVVFSDADLAVPITALEPMLHRFREGADVVIASREAPGARRVGEPAYRHLMGRVYNLVYQLLILPGVQDSQCGFKGFTRAAADTLFGNMLLYGEHAPIVRGGLLTGFDAELLFLARRWDFQVTEIPVEWFYGAGSKVRAFHDTPKMMRDILLIRWKALTRRYARTRPGA